MKTRDRAKYLQARNSINGNDIIFCTKCGDELTEFSTTDSAKLRKLVLEGFEKCRRTGKFEGDVCAKVFISDIDFEDFCPDE